jgi:hypothetical protein
MIPTVDQVNIVVVLIEYVPQVALENLVPLIPTADQVSLVVVLRAVVAAMNVTQMIMGSKDVRQLVICILVQAF